MRVVRSLLAAFALALALAVAAGCEAKLEGAACPCIEPAWTCVDGICVPNDGSHDPDAGFFPDGGFFPDAGFFPDGSFLPDSGAGAPDAGI